MTSQRTTNELRIAHALYNLRGALALLKQAGAERTARRVRLAISSAKGAQRHAVNKAMATKRA